MKGSTLLTWLFTVLMTVQGLTQMSYNGVISDATSGDPLIGASVLVAGTSRGTLTDLDGSFELSAVAGEVLEISYIGYKTTQLTLGQSTTLQIALGVNNNMMDEVVVIGYGTIKKSDLTGAVASIKAEDITTVPTNNAMQALQGRVAGLQVLSTSGDPGAAPVVRVRGITTLNTNDPFYVIDGVLGADITALNPNDIESIEVLKDAAATAIYGTRGAAGVILVTTKRGTSGKNRINVSVDQSIESVAQRVGVMNGREFATYINGIEPGTYNNLDALPNTDWQDLIFTDNASITNANFSVSGGSEQSTFYFSLGYFDQEGIIPKSGLQRYSAKINSTYSLSNHVLIGANVAASLTDKDNAPGVVNTALRAWPVDTPFLDDGVTFAEVNGGNPLAAINFQNSSTDALGGFANLYTEISFLSDFTFKSSLQLNASEGKGTSFTPVFFVGPLQQNDINNLSVSSSNFSSLVFENTLSYNSTKARHTIGAVAGYTSQDDRSQSLNGFTQGLIREDPLFWVLNAGQNDLDQTSSGISRNTLLSMLGRVNYAYDNKYLAAVSFRRDGSSKFGRNNKYANFYSVSAGWNISNEAFFPKNSQMNRLKVRASIGTTGNERIPGSAQYSLIDAGRDAVFGQDGNIVPGASFNGGGNPDLRWETTAQFDIGAEMGFFEDKLIAELDYYQKNTSDILVPLEPIGYTGIGSFRSIIFNAADIRTSGFEWNVEYRDNKGDWNYAIGVNGSTLSNEVTNIGQGFGADSLLIGGDLGNGQRVSRTAVGFPVGYFYGYEVDGVFQTEEEVESSASLFNQQPGDLKYKDINGDGRINGDDRTQIGNSIPNLIYGFNVDVGYKNLSLAAQFQGQAGNDIYNGKQAVRFTTLNYEDRFNENWTGPGTTNTDPRPSEGGNNFLPSSYFVEDGSFLRLRTLTLTYRVGNKLSDKLDIQNMSVFFRGTNLFTATSFSGYSPEIGAASAIDGVIDRGIYPITRIMSVGLNANF